MSNPDLKMLVDRFVEASKASYQSQLDGKHKGIRAAHKVLTECYCLIRDYGDDGIAALKALNTHDHLGVRVSAASKLMWVDLNYAMTTLQQLSRDWSKRYALKTMERNAAGAAATVFNLLYIRGAPLSPDPYIAWKEAKEKKASSTS